MFLESDFYTPHFDFYTPKQECGNQLPCFQRGENYLLCQVSSCICFSSKNMRGKYMISGWVMEINLHLDIKSSLEFSGSQAKFEDGAFIYLSIYGKLSNVYDDSAYTNTHFHELKLKQIKSTSTKQNIVAKFRKDKY